MPRDDLSRVLDMLLAAREALSFVDGYSEEQFREDKRTQSAVCLKLEVIGEAARAISQEYRLTYPEIPWDLIVGMRHRIVHEYFRLDLRVIWNTLRQDIPNLVVLLAPLVPPDTQKSD